MLSRIKGYLTKKLMNVGKKLGVFSPTFYTLLALAIGLLSACLFSGAYLFGINIISHRVNRTERLLIASLLLIVSGIFDGVDGLVARANNKKSNYGAYLDSFADRIVDGAVFFGIGLGGYVDWEIAFLALFLTLLISYTRAIGSENGINLSGIGFFERQERTLYIFVISVLSYMFTDLIIFEFGMLVFDFLAFMNLMYRFTYGLIKLKKTDY